MSDIFLSYSSKDKARAQIIAEAFETKGCSVWWDRVIPPGKTFDEVIEQELEAAECVIVLWSHESVKSKWVKTEASEGDRRGILVPVLIEEGVKIPLALIFASFALCGMKKFKFNISHLRLRCGSANINNELVRTRYELDTNSS